MNYKPSTILKCVHEQISAYFVSVNRFSSSAIVVGEVTSLTHELRNHSNFDIVNGQYCKNAVWRSHTSILSYLWNVDPAYPNPGSPVQSCLKFSAVLGATSALSSKVMRPTSSPPTSMSKYTVKNEDIGFIIEFDVSRYSEWVQKDNHL